MSQPTRFGVQAQYEILKVTPEECQSNKDIDNIKEKNPSTKWMSKKPF